MPDTSTCPTCANLVPAGATFCPNCGTAMAASPEEEASGATVVRPAPTGPPSGPPAPPPPSAPPPAWAPPTAGGPTAPPPPPPSGPWPGAGGPALAGYGGAGSRAGGADSRNRIAGVVALGGAALMLVGSLLDWATVSVGFTDVGISGWDGGDGKITAVIAVVAAVIGALLLTGRANVALKVVLIVAGAIALVVAMIDIADVSSVGDELGGIGDASVGVGLWIVTVAAIAVLAGGILARRPT